MLTIHIPAQHHLRSISAANKTGVISLLCHLFLMGDIYLDEKEGLSLEQSVLQKLQRTKDLHGQASSETLLIEEKLGEIYWADGNIEEAKTRFETCRDGFVLKSGSVHLYTLRSVLQVGFMYCILGHKENTQKMLKWAFDGRKELQMLQSAELTDLWIRNENILINEDTSVRDTYVKIKTNMGISLR